MAATKNLTKAGGTRPLPVAAVTGEALITTTLPVSVDVDKERYTCQGKAIPGPPRGLGPSASEKTGSGRPGIPWAATPGPGNKFKNRSMELEALTTPAIQRFYNQLGIDKNGKGGLSAKTVKNIHGILHAALQQACKVGYIRANPTDACTLPRVERKEIKPLDSDEIATFREAIQGHRFEIVYMVTLFTGLRRGEVLGLTWDAVDFSNGTLLINKQLQKIPGARAAFRLVDTKNSKGRTITAAPSILVALKRHRARQAEWRLKAGELWEDSNFVFTDELGHHLSPHTVYHNYKRIVASIGLPDAHFHDLRHSYAVAALKEGDDVKTVQQNLGHHSAAFTLDTYAHATAEMRRESAARMEQFIKRVSNA